MSTVFLMTVWVAVILCVTTLLAWRQRNEKRDLALLGSLSGLSGAGAALLYLEG